LTILAVDWRSAMLIYELGLAWLLINHYRHVRPASTRQTVSVDGGSESTQPIPEIGPWKSGRNIGASFESLPDLEKHGYQETSIAKT
jgi:hypothetical protein